MTSTKSYALRRWAAYSMLFVLTTAGCSQTGEGSTTDVSEASCGRADLREGLTLFQPPQSSLLIASVASVGEPLLEGKDRSETVWTPVTLINVEPLSGSQPSTTVYFHGGTAENHSTIADDYPGLVPGGRVVIAIGPDPSVLGGPRAHPPGPYVQTTMPIDQRNNVFVSGCLTAENVPGSKPVTAGVDSLDVHGKVENVTTQGNNLPLETFRAVVRKALPNAKATPAATTFRRRAREAKHGVRCVASAF